MPDSQNELAVDMAAAAQQVIVDTAAEEVSDAQASANMEETIDVPDAPFWGEGDEQSDDSETASSGEHPETSDSEPQVQDVSPDGTITYTVDGETKTISLAEAQKELSLVGGARRAFTDSAKLRKQLSASTKELTESRKFRESWDKLEDLKHEPEKLYEVIMGRPFTEFLKEVEDRVKLYSGASPEEKIALDQESEIRRLRQDVDREKRQRDRDNKKATDDKYEADKTRMQTNLERSFFKHEVKVDDPQTANEVKEMHWLKSVADLKKLDKQGVEITQKVIDKVYGDNAAVLRSFYSKSADKTIKEQSTKRSETAKSKAQLASVGNVKSSVSKNLTKQDPLSLFHTLKRLGR